MAIGAISSYLGSAAVASVYSRLSSATRINKPADEASASAVSQNSRRDVASFGTKTDSSVSDGKLAAVQNALERIDELAKKASSGVLNAEKKSLVQQEISGMTDEIAEIIGKRSKLFESMGIDGLDVTENFSPSVITDAISTVNAQRSRDSVLYDRMGKDVQANAVQNATTVQERILNAEYGTSTVLSIQKAVNQYNMIMQSQYANTQSSSQLQLLNMLV